MAYEIVTGSSGSNFLQFKGILGPYNQTLINPYSGYTITITGTKNINNAIYDGLTGTDTISMTSLGDVLTLVDSEGTIMVKNVEIIDAGLDGDIIIMAHATVTYGNVTLRGSEGNDFLWSNVGNDTVQGGAGDDNIDGGGGNDNLFGGEGNDYIHGGLGRDTLAGGAGNDTLVYNADAVWSSAYTLADLGSALSFASTINLGGKNRSFDVFNGDATDSLGVPTAGTDTLIMTSGNDVLSSSDAISPNSGLLWPRVGHFEFIDAGDGDDIVDLSGDAHQSVTIHGGNGNDILAGSNGNDTIYGDAGNDRLVGGEGADTLYGGAGNDIYYFDGQTSDTIIESSGTNDSIAILYYGLEDLTFTKDELDLKISVGGGYSMTIKNQYATDFSSQVEKLTFDDGSVVDLTTYYQNIDPVARNDVFSWNEGTVYTGNVLLNDTDSPGETLSVEANMIDLEGGTVTLNADGTFVYETSPGYTGTGSFSYTVFDNRGGSSTATVTVNILDVNNAPVAQDDLFVGDRFATISGNVLEDNGSGPDSDLDNDPLSVQSANIATVNGGTVVMNANGSFVYTAAKGFYGQDSFDYTLLDGKGGSDVGTAHLDILFAEDPYPEANNDSFSGSEDVSITGNVLLNDTDPMGDVLSAVAGTYEALNGMVTINTNGSFVYTPNANFHGIDSFEYQITDGNGGTAFATVTLNVASVNDNPVAIDDHYTTGGLPVTANVFDDTGLGFDSDVDGDAMFVQAGTYTTLHNGTVTIGENGTFTYTPASGFSGMDSFDYTLFDGKGGTDIGTVTIDVEFSNANPVAHNDSYSGREDNAIEGNVLANDTDADGDSLSVVAGLYTTASGGAFRVEADGSFFYRGALNFNGTDSVSYTVTDNHGGSATAQVTFSLEAVNDAPVAADDVFSGLFGKQISGNLLADNGGGTDSDVDGDTLTVQAQTITTAQGGVVSIAANGSFIYTPASGFYGDDGFDYTLLDGRGKSDTGTVSLTVAIPGSTVVGTGDSETIKASNNDEQIFGMGGNDILYGDDGFVPLPVAADKQFADTQIIPDFVNRTNIADLKPSGVAAMGIAAGNLSIDREAEATITFRKGGAGMNSSLGTYFIADDGTIKSASLLWNNVKTAGVDVEHNIELPVGPNGGDYGFFIIANGDNNNTGYAGLNTGVEGNIQFIYNYGKAGQREARITDDGKRISIVYDDGVKTQVLKGPAYFTTERGESAQINKDGKVHVASGLVDKNNLRLDIEPGDIAANQTSFTKNGITLTAFGGHLSLAPGERIGIQGPKWGAVVNPTEMMRVSFAASEKVILTLKGLDHGGAVDFKIYVNGDMDNPILVEHASGVRRTESVEFYLSDFGGLITAIDITPTKNTSYPADTFWLHDVVAHIPGGGDTDVLRIGFEDLANLGDADFEDVLFDLNISPDLSTEGESLLGGNDFLDGGAGNDTLYGEGGNDILVLGLGRDQAYGGAGADTFAITLVDSLLDRIHDFNAAEGDVINVSDVLEGYDPLTDDIANFIKFVQIGDDTHIKINADGVGNDFVGAVFVYGGTDADLATMIENGSLVANQSALA